MDLCIILNIVYDYQGPNKRPVGIAVTIQDNTKEFEFDKSDKVDLLIASDGLWDMIYEDNILNKINHRQAIVKT